MKADNRTFEPLSHALTASDYDMTPSIIDRNVRAGHILVVGFGSPHGDDQLGWLAAQRLIELCESANVCVKIAASPVQLFDWIDGAERLILCDACRGLGRFGEVRRFTWPASELIEANWSGTHDFSLVSVLELAQRLGRLPRDVAIWSVEVASPTLHEELTPQVAEALNRLISKVVQDVSRG